MNRLLYSIFCLFLVTTSCTVQKDQDDPSFLNKLYHNTTSKYNYHFNADLLMQESMAALTQEYAEDYDTLIPVYPYMANPNVENQYNTLDKVIEKVTTVSTLHRQSHWLDDNYLMLGKAQFLKKNYKEANAAFQYLVSNFDPVAPNEDVREEKKERARGKTSRKEYKQREKEREKRRKEIIKERKEAKKEAKKRRGKKKRRERPQEPESSPAESAENSEPLLASASEEPALPSSGGLVPQESNPDQYFMKHKPSYQEGLLWEARTWTAQENYFSAEARLSLLIKDPNTSDKVRKEALVALIDSYVKSKKYRRAVETIDEALEQDLDQNTKIRLAFLAGQISANLNTNQKAVGYFEKVLDYHPDDYEKYFYADLYITRLQGGDLIGKFQELLENPNNAPYKGQIYFTMGETYRDNYDFQRAIEAYKKVENPEFDVNPVTKAKAFMAIADINFDDESYPEAKQYYDKALSILSQADRRYKRASERSGQLTEIVDAVETIHYQDSLLLISTYTDDQRKDLALKIKKQNQKEQNEAITGGGNSNTVAGSQMVTRYGSAGSVESTFFAYDENSVSQGEKAFSRVWGDRALADNWRYSSTGAGFSSDDAASEGRTLSLGITQTEIDELLQEVPSTPEEKQQVNKVINEAMLKMAFGFRSELNNLDKSNEVLLELIERKPVKEIHAEALYLLYINAREAGNNSRANEYKRLFDGQFGDTQFAKKILSASTVIGQDDVAESALEQVRRDYDNGAYEKVLQMSSKSKTMFDGRTDLLAQFAMLEALATGKIKGREPYLEKLQYLVANYPKTKESEQAREYLRILGASVNTDITSGSSASPSSAKFSENVENTPHYILAVVGSTDKINPLKASISDFNKSFFQNTNLSISTVQVATENGREPAVLIRRFNNKKEAMDYHGVVVKNESQFTGGNNVTLLPLAITNFRFLTTEKRLPEYKLFLEEHYGLAF